MGFNPSTDYPGYDALSILQRQKVLQTAIDQLVVRGAVADYAPILWDCVERQQDDLVLAWKRNVRPGRLGERDIGGFSPTWDEFFRTAFLPALPRAVDRTSPRVQAKMAREAIEQLQSDVFDFLEEAANGALSKADP
jgi:hypothetical protein